MIFQVDCYTCGDDLFRVKSYILAHKFGLEHEERHGRPHICVVVPKNEADEDERISAACHHLKCGECQKTNCRHFCHT